jgi:MoaA/NifB/PqqE/SkfB family radical SAM enzyme
MPTLTGRHIVVRHREPLLEPSVLRQIGRMRAAGAARIGVLTNARFLGLPDAARRLRSAGADEVVIKLFGLDATTHDAHTRVVGSFEQALTGLRAARAAGLGALVCFPLAAPSDAPAVRAARTALANELTGANFVELPEPEVETHANEYRYNLVELRPDAYAPWWANSFFPMVHTPTGPACNIRCTYCNVEGGTDQRLFDVLQIEHVIDAAADQVVRGGQGRGQPTIDFIGGEPTLHPELPRLVAHARRRGFEHVYICTNGVLLLRPGYLDTLVSAGLTGVRFSFHDHRPEMANALADVPGLGARYVDVARALLSQTRLHVHLYRLILATTTDSIGDYLRWLVAHNQTGQPLDLTFGLPSMRGRMSKNRHLYPRLEDLRPLIERAVAEARSLGIEPLIHHAPACISAEARRVACVNVTTLEVDGLTATRRDVSFEGDSRHALACASCAVRDRCHGLPAVYWEADPDAAAAWPTPFSPAAIAAEVADLRTQRDVHDPG